MKSEWISAEEVQEVRRFLEEKNGTAQIFTKIETRQAVDAIEGIIEASDGIMIARGDLGAEVPYEKLPAIQDHIVLRCREMGKPVIVATHMLESMKEFPIPTRAEMTDVAHAASTLADCTMLSGETANGKHPPKAVEAMHRLLLATEEHMYRLEKRSLGVRDDTDAQAEAAVRLAETTHASAILVFTRTGRTAKAISRFRPTVPVIACTEEEITQKQLSIVYGVSSLYLPFEEQSHTLMNGIQSAKDAGLIQEGSNIIAVSAENDSTWSVHRCTA